MRPVARLAINYLVRAFIIILLRGMREIRGGLAFSGAFRHRLERAPTAENPAIRREWYGILLLLVVRSAGFSSGGTRENPIRMGNRRMISQSRETKTATKAVFEYPRGIAARELSLSMCSQMEKPSRRGPRSSRNATSGGNSKPEIRQVDLKRDFHAR